MVEILGCRKRLGPGQEALVKDPQPKGEWPGRSLKYGSKDPQPQKLQLQEPQQGYRKGGSGCVGSGKVAARITGGGNENGTGGFGGEFGGGEFGGGSGGARAGGGEVPCGGNCAGGGYYVSDK